MNTTPEAGRAQIIAGLRELANLLEANPGLPITKYPDFMVHAGQVDMDMDDQDEDAKRAAVDAVAAALDLPTQTHQGHHSVTWSSAAAEPDYSAYRLTYRVTAITEAAMLAHRAAGE